MKTILAVLATGEYWRGAEVLFHTLKKYGHLPDTVEAVVLGMDSCSFARAVPISQDYSWVPVSAKYFPKVADKFQALSLECDRLILMDADMLCLGDCSLLWSHRISRLPFYAVRDTASYLYYRAVIDEIGLDPDILFNAGTMVFNMYRLGPGFLPRLLEQIGSGELRAYDGGDQGYLNHYFQQNGTEVGFLPLEYNACTDPHFPRVPEEVLRVAHFTGENANPWDPHVAHDDWRWPLFHRWKKEQEDSIR